MIVLSIKSRTSFSVPIVIGKVQKVNRVALRKIGVYVKRKAQKSIRKQKGKTSAPGSPPFSHGKQWLKKFLLWAEDVPNQSVVIGPTLINKPTGAPATLEYGGSTDLEGHRFVSGSKYGNRRRYIATHKQIHVKRRPYMGPALKAESSKFAGLWQNSIR